MKQVKFSLSYFLKTGRLEDIEFGISSEELKELLGEPEHIESRSGIAKYYCYGDFEFYFFLDQPSGLVNIVYSPRSLGRQESVRFSESQILAGLSLEKAASYLDSNRIEYSEKEYPFDDSTKILVTEGDVCMFFDNQLRPGYRLLKLSSSIEENLW